MGSSRGNNYKEMEDDNSTQILPEFQKEIAKARKIIKDIEASNEDIEDLRQRYSKATTAVAEKEINNKINSIIKDATFKNSQLKTILTVIEDQVKTSVASKPDDPETNIKSTNLNAIKCKVKEVLEEFQKSQLSYKQTVKEKIKREAQYMDSSLSEREIDEICNDPNSVRQVDELFKDLAMLVHHQGMMIDDIESNVKSTKVNVTHSNQHLQKGKEYHQKSKKKMCCLILIGVIILVAIIVPVSL